MNVEVEDIVMVHGLHMGKVVDKFLSATGAAVYDIKLIYSPFRVAALEDHIVFNYGPPGHQASRQAAKETP